MAKNIAIKSHRGKYRVFFEDGLDFLEKLKQRRGFWVIDRNVFNFYRRRFDDINPDSVTLFDAQEENKTIEAAMKLCRELAVKSCRRNTDFISVGGGIVQDVSGFVASTLYRGLKWIYVPTTLLAQADSCIGSKTSLNVDSYKNLVGTFYPPKEIFLSTEFLNTLGQKEMFSGMGEIVKLQLMKAKNWKELIGVADRLAGAGLPDMLLDSLMIKKRYIERDEFDSGERRLLNYGHCFGHALESVSEFAIPHGLAVVAGMIFADIISRKRGWINKARFNFVVKRILIPSFHVRLLEIQDAFFDADKLWTAINKDKKRTGLGAAIILPRHNFELQLVQDLSREELIDGTEQLKRLLIKSGN